jgi:SAM-dependent methyltransferase
MPEPSGIFCALQLSCRSYETSIIRIMMGLFKGTNSKFLFLRKAFGRRPFSFLDVGAGNHSASKTVALFPDCAYYGVDLSKDYNNSEADFKAMKGFYEMDLTLLDFRAIPDHAYDGIWIVHVIEHLKNGEEVLDGLMAKLKPGGFMYVEYPGPKSKHLPSMHGTLNFYDDPTHVRLYDVEALSERFKKNGFRILESGTRRNWYFIVSAPFRVIQHIFRGKKLIGNIFWDILGFAEFLFVQKEK